MSFVRFYKDLQAIAGARSDDLRTSGVASGPSFGGHGALAGELLIEDNAQVGHLVLIGLRVNGLGLLVWAWWRWSPKLFFNDGLGLMMEMDPKAPLLLLLC